jgi:hypothetical protein
MNAKISKKGIEMLCEAKMEYLYLVSLISSDNILTIEDAEKNLGYIDEGEEAVKEANIPEEKKEEFYKYFASGRNILKQDIERFKEKEKEKEL